MQTLVVFDSNFGNTKKVADYIATLFGSTAVSRAVGDVTAKDLVGLHLLIVGSPINAWNPTAKIKSFLRTTNPVLLKGIRGAAFDTRLNSFLSGNAAKKIARIMENSGVKMVAPPVGFFVKTKEGPLSEGELKRAEHWVQGIKTKL